MSARGVAKSTTAKHRAERDRQASAHGISTSPGHGGRGRRRRRSPIANLLASLGLGRLAQQERDYYEVHLRELRLATATLRAEMAVLRFELEQATALAQLRAADAARLALVLPFAQRAFAAAAERRVQVYLGYAPDVKQLEAVRASVIDLTKRTDVLELEPEVARGNEIVLSGSASSESSASTELAVPQRRTA